jgi:large subunit ribosomal protein L22
MNILNILPKKSSKIFKAVLESAVANAQESEKIDVDTLYVKSVFVNQGPSLKRYHAGPMGRVKPYKKRMSHITMILEES